MSQAVSIMAAVFVDSGLAPDALAEDFADFAEFQVCFGSEPDALCRIAFDCNNGAAEIDLH